ncbi:MAG: class I SAM-dependent methyltransferase [Lentisphaeria bacterium]|nr:class I SAM-dependent methyltransferase [Lentisphaeria bacterium]
MDHTEKTDWDLYYKKPFPTAALLRRITSGRLIRAMKKHACFPADQSPLQILEFGGGNSSFASAVTSHFPCKEYRIADTNHLSIEQFQQQSLPCPTVGSVHDVLKPYPDNGFDFVFSAGLIEHFSPEQTALAVQNHFAALKPGGIAAFLFPADSILYRTVRKLAEWTGHWNFPDERPLTAKEVKNAAQHCTLLHEEWIRCILLTQMLLIFRKDM